MRTPDRRLVVDLQGPDASDTDRAPRPQELTTHRVPLDDPSRTDYWQRWGAGLDCTR